MLIAAGLLAATGFQPLGFWPLTLAALAFLIDRIVHARSAARAALAGWLFGLGYFSLGNNWIATAFTYQAAMPAWLGWIAVVLLAVYLAVYPALAAYFAAWLARRFKAALVPALAGAWIITAMTAALPAGLMLLPLHGAGAEGRLGYTLVQPNIGQDTINDPSLYEGQFQGIARLSLPRVPGARRIVLWPEGGLPDYLRPGYPQYFYNATTFGADPALARARIGRVIGPGSLLLTGATDLVVQGDTVTAARNVVTALGPDGAIRSSYAKAHLVPYGEYLPLRAWLAPLGLSRLVSGSLDFIPGPGPRTLDLGPHGKAGLQICYEIIFSGEVADRAHRPDYIFNPSNDGWFGAWGPPQHLAQARMRAIEEGLPVLRATTTGISAVIDADGVVRQFVPRLAAGRVDGMVPPAHAPTPFARLGNRLALAWALLLLGTSLVVARRRGDR